MNMSGIDRLATSMAETGIRQEVGVAMLKKAQDIQKSTATQLLAAIPAMPGAQNLPAHLGNTINITA